MYLISLILLLVCALVSVAFFTLFERKILGYTHLRVGPNKNFFQGILQPISDLVKLFGKIDFTLSFSYLNFFLLLPALMTLISISLWMFFLYWGSENNLKFFFIVMMCLNGIGVFFFLAPGWSSGSFYSTLGSYRASAQVISYEGIFFFCILIFLFFSLDYGVYGLLYYNFFGVFNFLFLGPLWICSILSESNRSPFDFAEGESELVSGFNTEYGGGFFSLIFLSEYMSILFLCYFTSMMLTQSFFMFFFFFFFFILMFVWIRVSFPRLRYDKLMMLSWKSLMLVVTGIFLLLFFFVVF